VTEAGTIVALYQVGDRWRWRIVRDPPGRCAAVGLTLEDGYRWLMQHQME
jgi:hypothetical protein